MMSGCDSMTTGQLGPKTFLQAAESSPPPNAAFAAAGVALGLGYSLLSIKRPAKLGTRHPTKRLKIRRIATRIAALLGMSHMRTRLVSYASAFGFVLTFVYFAMARPVTTQDLAGRTICWDNGETSTYLRGGTWTNSRHGSGTWKVTPAGLEIHSDSFGGALRVELQDDGTILDATYNVPGHFCKI